MEFKIEVFLVKMDTFTWNDLMFNNFFFFLINKKIYIEENYLMQKNIRQREKYKGKRKRKKKKKGKDTKYTRES